MTIGNRILRQSEVMQKTGLSRTTLWRLEKQNKFPKKIQISERNIGWLSDDIDDWINNKRANK